MNATAISPTITPAELAARISAGKACELLDVRTPAEFGTVHAAGARLLPLDRLDVASVLATRAAPCEPLYILCKSGGRAKKAREKFCAAGCDLAVVVEGGTDAWVAAGLPSVRGTSRVISLERQVRIVAGLIVLAGVILALTVHPYFIYLAGFVGAGLTFAGITDFCGMGMLLARMPWNRGTGAACSSK
jgi:rhodanese-related sulfurtransferase